MSVHNFNSGPSILPQPVLEQAAKAIHDFNGTGLSILEIGHRTSHFQSVLDAAIGSVKRLMQLDDQYEVLFLHGGATTQFMQVPMNLLDQDETITASGVIRHLKKLLYLAMLFWLLAPQINLILIFPRI
jgi:phosphoserine aminotransferase